ncbi:UxaA family hydrolase [Lewinella sp. JB7]|uniref:UxaA family hydrolase n=1 Tax=Lewinella sp. JB7 TaxID=2962887 RepID=UPI0020C9D500|nr:altronate dehydratase family protein [Lewinella sp. JB7]MCP9236125.1 altronate dehydratase family protein [Lewinella sp. JB7]
MAEVLKIHPADNVIVALRDFRAGDVLATGPTPLRFAEDVPTKHKFAERDFAVGEIITMYGVTVGKTLCPVPRGTRITTENVVHASSDYAVGERRLDWEVPDVSAFTGRTFDGYHRADGQVGTRNYWLVIPLVFCENRNVDVIRSAMLEKLGYVTDKAFSVDVDALIQRYRGGSTAAEILQTDILRSGDELQRNRVFPNVDGIKFLTHQGGCGGIRRDSEALCRLLAGYLNNPNVAGGTVLSLGCQNAQIGVLRDALDRISPDFRKPLHILEQQASTSERDFIADGVRATFTGLMEVDRVTRSPAELRHLTLGLECGGSDGFSGISANPALGYTSDLLVTLGGKAILSEFPELNGVEQELLNRCVTDAAAEKFAHLMRSYSKRAEEVGSAFSMNPSPGNIRDGLITDAMKSAGAAKKGGTSPVVDVLDYTEPATRPGLNLLCTPGNDVESTTGLAGSGANLIVFTTGLGTPTGNPVAPVVKMASNTVLAERMADIIDINAGTVISGEDTIRTKGEELLDLLIEVASGRRLTRAERLGQDDFIPWKRGVSL